MKNKSKIQKEERVKSKIRVKLVGGAGKRKKDGRSAWNSFLSEFRKVYHVQHPNAPSTDVMRDGGKAWRAMREEEKAPYYGEKAVQKNLGNGESEATYDKVSNPVVNKGPLKTKTTFREGYINRLGLRRSLLSRRSVPEVHKRGQPMKYCIYLRHLTLGGGGRSGTK